MRLGVTFDHTSPELAGQAFWSSLRELSDRGPVTWVESNGGYWAVTSYDAVLAAAQDYETFSSSKGVALGRPGPDALPYILPIEFDPPRQRIYRRQINPHFVPKAVARVTEGVRQIADELIDNFVDRGSCDLSADFARKFPGTVFFRLIVSCTDEDFRRAEPAARLISFESNDPEKFARGAAELRAWAGRVFEARRGQPPVGDAVDGVMTLPDTGEHFEDHELMSGLQILAQGGIGTSASVIGVIMRVLAEDPHLQHRVRADLRLIAPLVEECIRIEPPLPMIFRTAMRDAAFFGADIKAGESVGLFFGAANRDPGVYVRPDEVDIDRRHNRHLGFGAGPHRCIGSNLARLQIRIAIEQLLTRLGSFRLAPGAEVLYFNGQARGPASLPIEFSATKEG